MNDRRKQRDGICPKGPQHCARAFASRCNTAEPRQLPTAVEVPTPRDRLDTERDVVQRRLANFKAIQEKFQQDREDTTRGPCLTRGRLNGPLKAALTAANPRLLAVWSNIFSFELRSSLRTAFRFARPLTRKPPRLPLTALIWSVAL